MKRKIISIYPEPNSDLKEKILALSKRYNRSMNQQIITMLEDWIAIYEGRAGGNKNVVEGKVDGQSAENLIILPSFGRRKRRRHRNYDLVAA